MNRKYLWIPAAVCMLGTGIYAYATNSVASMPKLAQETASAQYSLTINGLSADAVSLLSYSLSEQRPPSGRVQFSDLTATAVIGKASPGLMLACANGEIFTSAVLRGQRLEGPQHQFVTITLGNVSISSYRPQAKGLDLPTEEFSLNFTGIRVEYVPVNPDGSLGDPIVTTWDLSGGRPQEPVPGAYR